MEILSQCPICNSTDLTGFLKSKDYFLTREEFNIVQCGRCGLKFLNPRPDVREISRYYESPDYISHDNERKGIINLLYSWIRSYSIRNKVKIAGRHAVAKTILDIGCGTGEFLSFCKKSGWEVTGIEPNPKARDFCIRNHQLNVLDEPGLEILPDGSFDVITMWHVLEHVYPLDQRMITINRLIKNNGTVIIAIPNSNSWDASHYKEAWAAYDLPRHIYHFTKKTILTLASKYNMELVETIPMKFDAFYIALLSEKYLSGKSGFFKAGLNGFKSNNFAKRNNSDYSSLIFVLKPGKGQK